MALSEAQKSFRKYQEFTRKFPCDSTFLVGPDKIELKGHRSNLATASVVLENGLLDSGEAVLSFKDLNVDGFKLMLAYIYKIEISLESEVEAVRLLQVAKFFQIRKLIDKAIKKMEGILNNVKCLPKVLSEAMALKMPELKNLVLDCISWKGKEVLESEEFLDLNFEAMNLIIANESLKVPSEITVFDAAVRWAEHEITKKNLQVTCQGIRAELGEALYSIRIPLIPMADYLKEIQLIAARKDVFTEEELNEMSNYIFSNLVELDDEQRAKITIRFPSTARNPKNEAPELDRFLFQHIDEVDLATDYEPPTKVQKIKKEKPESNDENSESSEEEILGDSDYEIITLNQGEENDEDSDISDNDNNREENSEKENSTIRSSKRLAVKDFSKLYKECQIELKSNPGRDTIIRQDPYVIKQGRKGALKVDKLYFPNLTTFMVKYFLQTNNPAAFKRYLGSLSANELVFVKTQLNNGPKTRNFLQSISGLTNVLVQVNELAVFKMDTNVGSITVSRIDPEGILEGLNNWKHVCHIHLEFIHLPSLDILPKTHLQTLTLKGVTGFQSRTSYARFLASCPKLEEFSLDDFGFKGNIGTWNETNPQTSLVLQDLGSNIL